MKNAPAFGRVAVSVSVLSFTLGIHAADMENIRINQIGFYPESRKVAVVISDSGNAPASEFQIVSLPDSAVVLRGRLSGPFGWAESGEKGQQADFSALTAPGRYTLVLPDSAERKSRRVDPGDNRLAESNDSQLVKPDDNQPAAPDDSQPVYRQSYPFTVSDRAFKDAANASMRAFYFQRCSQALPEAFGGKWSRAAGHPDTDVAFHPSSGRPAGDGPAASPGGWYDAGDFGKYVVNSGISVGTLLAFYENFPDYFPDKSLNIPESGNGRPDILDEVKYNLDWMKTMQDKDGGVFFKLSTLSFPGYVMPAEDRGQRFIIGKSTTSALNFAAAMAQAGRVYAPFDRAYAKDCVKRAARAWDWAVKNPNAAFRNPDDVKTGEYRDTSFGDEFVWAAAELFITTKGKRFAKFLRDRDVAYAGVPSWQNVHSLAALSLASVRNGLDAKTLDAARKSIVAAADRWTGEMDRHLYRIPNVDFIWGSNSVFANMGIGMIYAYRITGDRKYLLGAAEVADYLLGKNAVGVSFVSGFGTKAMSNPHHRQCVAAGVGAIPGFLAGGPNAGQQDRAHEVTYSSTFPAKSYEDVYKSYASNEIAINWNAPAVFLFGALDALMR